MTSNGAYSSPPAETLCAALNCDNIAIQQLLQFYDPYINYICTIKLRNSEEQIVGRYIDEDNKQIVSITFIRAVRKFAGILRSDHL